MRASLVSGFEIGDSCRDCYLKYLSEDSRRGSRYDRNDLPSRSNQQASTCGLTYEIEHSRPGCLNILKGGRNSLCERIDF